MRDKRPVDELNIEELERILAIRKREERQARANHLAERRVAHVQPMQPRTPTDEAGLRWEGEDDNRESALKPRPVFIPPIRAATLEIEDEPAPVPVAIETPPAMPAEPRFEDDDLPRRAPALDDARPTRKLWNRVLLGVEVVAIVGLVGVFAALFNSLQSVTATTNKIQQDAQASLVAMQVAPTATPTINIAAIVLPGGHLYDADTASAKLNLAEVPAQYRDAYASAALVSFPAIEPTRSAQAPLNIRIPALAVQSAIVTGDDWNALQRGVGHHIGSANPGELGNMVLSGHNDVYGQIFKDLEKLKPGDKIYISTSREYTYVVRSTEIVLPTEVRVLANTQRTVAQVTLITCHPYQVDTHRYIVYAELE